MMVSANPRRLSAGQVANTATLNVRTLIYPKNGATQGSSLVTATGTPVYGQAFFYTLNLTRAWDGRVNPSTGTFLYTVGPGPASLTDFLARFAAHLMRYHDVQVAATATTINIISRNHGYTPSLILEGGPVTVSAVQTNALAGSPILPGQVVGAYRGPSKERLAALPGSASLGTLLPGNAQFGVVIESVSAATPNNRTSEDTILQVAFQGTVGVWLNGANPITPATTSLLLGLTTSTFAGRFAVGTGDATTGTVSLGGSQGYGYQGTVFQPEEMSVLPGQVFPMRVNS